MNRKLRAKVNEVREDFRSTTRKEFDVESGALSSGWNGSIRRDFGMPYSLSWKTNRPAYILHHGIEPGTSSQRERGAFTYTSGIRKSNFINEVLDRHMDDVSRIMQEGAADIIVDELVRPRAI